MGYLAWCHAQSVTSARSGQPIIIWEWYVTWCSDHLDNNVLELHIFERIIKYEMMWRWIKPHCSVKSNTGQVMEPLCVACFMIKTGHSETISCGADGQPKVAILVANCWVLDSFSNCGWLTKAYVGQLFYSASAGIKMHCVV